MINYISLLSQLSKSCLRLSSALEEAQKNKQDFDDFMDSDYFELLLSPIKAGFDFYKTVNLSFSTELDAVVDDFLTLERYENYNSFEYIIKYLESILNFVNEPLNDFCSSFDDEEKERMNESVHDYLEECWYSSVAMSVSAVESRLFKLMNNANPGSRINLEKLTLGQLISEYLKNSENYSNCVPSRHDHLLSLCNAYRVFSVHPKGHKINKRMASSVLNLAVEFLTDPEAKLEQTH